MNLFGKIFTLLIFFLSITFLIVSIMVGVSHRDWKKMVADNESEAKILRNQLEAAEKATREATQQIEAEKEARQAQLSQLFSELKYAESDMTAAETDNRAASKTNADIMADVNVANTQLVAQEKEINNLKGQNEALRNDIVNKYDQSRSMTNEIHELKRKLDELNELNGD